MLLPDLFQQLNWTTQPIPGDIQFNWRFVFPNGCPRHLARRMVISMTSIRQEFSYKFYWDDGVLLRISQVI